MSALARPGRLAAVLAAAVALAAGAGCQQRDLPPDATYRALVRAVADQDEAAAWELLSTPTRKRLEERARVAASAAPGVVPASARTVLVGDAALGVAPPRAITVASRAPDRAGLRVEAPGAPPTDVTLLREGGAWKVDLPDR